MGEYVCVYTSIEDTKTYILFIYPKFKKKKEKAFFFGKLFPKK